MVSNDPDFETKAADVIGLYLNPPQHAAVFCVDEKTAILRVDPMALDQLLHPTLDPDAARDVLTTGLPASPGAASGATDPPCPSGHRGASLRAFSSRAAGIAGALLRGPS